MPDQPPTATVGNPDTLVGGLTARLPNGRTVRFPPGTSVADMEEALAQMEQAGALGESPTIGVPEKVDPNTVAGERPRSTFGQRMLDLITAPAQGPVNVGVGLVKGAINDALNTGQLFAEWTPQGRALTAGAAKLAGTTPEAMGKASDVVEQKVQPVGPAQTLGYTGAQLLAAAKPGAAASQAATRLTAAIAHNPTVLRRAAALLGRMGTEGVAGATIAKAQGDDPTLSGGIAAGVPVLGAVARGLGGGAKAAGGQFAEFAARHDIPLDWAYQTGSKVARGVQSTLNWLSVPSAVIADSAAAQRGAALRGTAGKLTGATGPASGVEGYLAREEAGKAIQARADQEIAQTGAAVSPGIYPSAITGGGQAAGKRAERDVQHAATQFRRVSKEAYGAIERMAAEDGERRVAGIIDKGNVFNASDLNRNKTFDRVFRDAFHNGYRGSREELRSMWNERLRNALADRQFINSQNEGWKVLEYIAEKGGIKRFDEGWPGEMDRLWEMSTAARPVRMKKRGRGYTKQQFRDQGAIGGVPGVVNRSGKSVWEMLELMQADPEIAPYVDGLRDGDMFALIEDMARVAGQTKPVTVGQMLAQQGVAPGRRWWDDLAAHEVDLADLARAGGDPQAAARSSTVAAGGFPANVSNVRKLAQEFVDPFEAGLTRQEADTSRALVALKQLANLPTDEIPAMMLEDLIGGLKSVVRKGTKSETSRNRGAGMASVVLAEAERALADALKDAPDARKALMTAREAWAAKDYADRVKRQMAPRRADSPDFESEGATIYRKYTSAGDASIEEMQRVKAHAPEALFRIGRALYDDVLRTGKWDQIENLGEIKKSLLFGSPAQVKKVEASIARFRRLREITRGKQGNMGAGELVTNLLQSKNVEDLGVLAKQMPDLSRAVFDDILWKVDKAADPGDQIAALGQWTGLDARAQKYLVPNDAQRADLNTLFALWEDHLRRAPNAKSRMAAQAVGAGTSVASSLVTGNWSPLVLWGGAQAGFAGVSALMHNPKAVKLMIRLLDPSTKPSGAQVAVWTNQLARMAGSGSQPAETER